MDLRTTRDGQIVILHDPSVDRTTNGSGLVADLTLAELKTLDAGSPAYPSERIPTLAEALDLIRATPALMLLDLKSASLGRVIRLVRQHRAENSVIFGLRRAKDVARIRSELPGTTTLAFVGDRSEAGSFAAAGADIVRLWSDWVDKDPALVRRTQAAGPQVWVMVGRRAPHKRRDWRALHDRMVAAGTQGLITDQPGLVARQ